MTSDELHMREALRLARRGRGKTSPNPAVGCVIVKRGKVIGRGWHRRAGLPHAEIEALASLARPSLARGATAYVTLEPCSTRGRTPPCTEALRAAGLARVVVGATDPNPAHRGRGLSLLRRAGVRVDAGILAADCEELNPEFSHRMLTGLPWVIAKCGLSLDGRLTRPPGEAPWITSPAARADAMKLRARVDAILVGAGTVRADDPELTLRGVCGDQPWRVVWAPRRPPPARARIFHDGHKDRTLVLRQASLRAALRALARRGINSVLAEGGGHTLGSLFGSGLVQEVAFYLGPMLAGGAVPAVAGVESGSPARARELRNPKFQRLGDCLKVTGFMPAGG